MKTERSRPKFSLPYASPLPDGARGRAWARSARVVAYALLAAAIIGVVVQVQHLTMRNLRKAAEWDRKHPGLTLNEAVAKGRPKAHKGAMGRWRRAIDEFQAGRNIYESPPAPSDADARADGQVVYLHPNTPFTVILLSPLAKMSVRAMTLTWNVLKVLVIAAAILMVAELAGHRGRRIPDWVLGLGVLWVLMFVIGDIQHGNTNVFVLGAIAFHLWLYRRGRNLSAGAVLALAICLKMTPALFVLYWLYQRNWKLLAGVLAGGVLMAVVVPVAVVGPARFSELTGAWLANLILPGLMKGAWYPIHINQSLSGVMSRYFLDGQYGDIFWNADDDPHYAGAANAQWITLVKLSPAAVKWLIRCVQCGIVALSAWAIGWRKLPRDDGRRLLHYGLIALGIMLLNQRTWDHHAAILLIPAVGVWRAIAYGRMPRRMRAWTLVMTLTAGMFVWLTGADMFKVLARAAGHSSKVGRHWADVVDAYGPIFFHFALMFAVAILLAVALRNRDNPYAEERQKLKR